jgi:hypothetical protein
MKETPDIDNVMAAQEKIRQALSGFSIGEIVVIMVQVLFTAAGQVGAPLDGFTKMVIHTVENAAKIDRVKEMFDNNGKK